MSIIVIKIRRILSCHREQTFIKYLLLVLVRLLSVRPAEFDYSGTQACKALKKLGYEIVLSIPTLQLL